MIQYIGAARGPSARRWPYGTERVTHDSQKPAAAQRSHHPDRPGDRDRRDGDHRAQLAGRQPAGGLRRRRQRHNDQILDVIDQVDNRWQAVSFGYAELARKVTRVRKRWPKVKGYNPQLIAVFQTREYLFTIPEKGPDNLTSLESTQLGRIPPKTVKDFSELDNLPNVINRLRPLVQKSIRSK